MHKRTLAKFGQRSKREVENFKILIIIWLLIGTCSLNMAIFLFLFFFSFPLIEVATWPHFFPPKNNLLNFLHLPFLFSQVVKICQINSINSIYLCVYGIYIKTHSKFCSVNWRACYSTYIFQEFFNTIPHFLNIFPHDSYQVSWETKRKILE